MKRLGAVGEEVFEIQALLKGHIIEELVGHPRTRVKALQLQDQQGRTAPEAERLPMCRP